jgi:iron complex outermembrane receptor protein
MEIYSVSRCPAAFLILTAGCICCPSKSNAQSGDLLDLPLAQLMNMEISTASRFPQKKMDAPAAVTVITAEDIKDYGYRTLADVLRSIRGVYVTYDRSYEFFGARGFSRSGDFNSRLLLMVDGRRVNDVIYDTAYIGTDGIVDLENVARIEFVPGSGSALYGSNAFFGVMNIFTKHGKDTQGAEIAGGFGSYGQDREKATLGYRFENGADVLLSASRQRIDGHQSLSFDRMEQPDTAPFTSQNLDGDKTDRLFGKFSFGDFVLEGAYSDRDKSLPTASYAVDVNAPESYNDINGFVEGRYEKAVNERITASARAFWGFYDFNGIYYYSDVLNRDRHRSQWWGTELKGLFSFGAHKLVLGGEYQNNFVQQLNNFDVDPYTEYFDIDTGSYRYGFYLQDEFALTSQLTLSAGVRYDNYSASGDTTNPRLALIYKPWNEIAFKLIYGTAFRAPNLAVRTDGLKPEKIESLEAVTEYQATRNLRLTATAFYNDVTDLINKIPDPNNSALLIYTNNQRVTMQGLEFEGEYRWGNGARLRGSYAYADAKDQETGEWLDNSPNHLAKLNVSAPLWRDWLHGGAELQYVGERKSKASKLPGYTLVNLTLNSTNIVPGLAISASLYNVLDKRYSAVAGVETSIDQIPQDGRNFRVWLSYRF